MPRSDWAREPQLLSLCVWSPCSATREAATVRGPCTAMKSGPRSPQLEKALTQKRRPNAAKKKERKKEKKERKAFIKKKIVHILECELVVGKFPEKDILNTDHTHL